MEGDKTFKTRVHLDQYAFESIRNGIKNVRENVNEDGKNIKGCEDL